MIQYWQKERTRRNNNIWMLHLQGKSDVEIARKYKLTRQRVCQIRHIYAKKQPVDRKYLTK